MQLSRIGPFALEEPLDGSATGNVLRGVHVDRQMAMAVKLLPRGVAREAMGRSPFAEDVKLLQKLEHPGIARILGGAVEKGQPYLVLELVEGESLRERLRRRGKLPWEMAVEIADGIAEALVDAHEKGFVHQRLTPARVLLPVDGGVKLVGFDCKWADRDEVVGLRGPMEVAHYLSPEQFRGKPSAGLPPCDLFSLGVILFECLTGEMPWPVDSPGALVQARRDGPAPRVSSRVFDSPVWLDGLTEKLLAKVRSQRLQTAEEARRALVLAKDKAHAGTGAAQHALSGKGKGAAGELRKFRRRRTESRDASPFYERVWFLAACLAGLVGGGVWSLWPASEADLIAKARPLMASESPVDWKRAETQYLGPLLERFPETEYAEEIRAFADRYAMHRAEERVKNLGRFGRQPKTEGERFFAEAWEYERFGDRLSAWKKYEALVHLLGNSAEETDRAYVGLAQRQIAKIKEDQQTSADQIAFVEQYLEQAKDHAEGGRLLEARRILDSVLSLYGKNREVRPQVERAREQLRDLDGDEG